MTQRWLKWGLVSLLAAAISGGSALAAQNLGTPTNPPPVTVQAPAAPSSTGNDQLQVGSQQGGPDTVEAEPSAEEGQVERAAPEEAGQVAEPDTDTVPVQQQGQVEQVGQN